MRDIQRLAGICDVCQTSRLSRRDLLLFIEIHLVQNTLLLIFRDEVWDVEHLWRQIWNLLLLQ